MKKTASIIVFLMITLLTLLIVTVPSATASENSWTTKTPMQEARGRLGIAVVNGKIYAIGGDSGYFFGTSPNTYNFMGRFQYESTNEEYDPIVDEWTFKEPMPTPRYHFAITVYKNKIYCIGGLTSDGETGVNEVYDPATNTWETKTAMPTPRMRLDANVVNGKIYLIGGHTFNNYTTLNLCEIYDPATNTWTTKTVSPPYSLTNEASTVIDDKIYFLGTESSPLPPYVEAFIEIYDPENDSWTAGGQAPVYDSSAAVGVTTGVFAPKRMHVLDEDTHYVYDPQTDNWTVGLPMLTSRGYAGIAVLNDTLYVVGGINLPSSDTLIGEISSSAYNEQYTPSDYIPEFSLWTVLPLFLIAALVAVVYRKKLTKRHRILGS